MKLLLAGILSASIFGCSNNQKDRALMISFKQAIDQSTEIITEKTRWVQEALLSKLSDPALREKALIWQPKALLIKEYADTLNNYIQALEEQLKKEAGLKTNLSNEPKMDDTKAPEIIFYKRNKQDELKVKIDKFRDLALAIDEEAKLKFEKDFNYSKDFADSVADKSDYWINPFKGQSTIAALAVLSRFQNNTRSIENKMVTFFYEHTGYLIHRFENFQVLISQNANIVKPGNQVVIEAGVGAFTTSSRPEFTMDGKKYGVNETGVVSYKFKAPQKPGEYSVPVSISYIKPDGLKASITRIIEYTVFDTTRN